MLIGRKTFGLGGAILAGLLACANPAQAVIKVDSSGQVTGGQVFYAKETVAATVTVDGEAWHVAATPASGEGNGRLVLRHPLGRNLADGDSATITYTLTNMQFHGANAALTVEEEGSNAAVTATLASGGGTAGDTTAAFTVEATSDTGTIANTRTVLLTLRGIAVNPATRGSIQVQVAKNSITRPDWTLSGVIGVRRVGVLRESVSPVSATATFGNGFRSFVSSDFVRSDKLAASVGSLDFSVSDGSHVASDGTALTMLSDVIASGAITFTGDFSFSSGVFLSTAADCSSTGDDRVAVTGSGATTRASTVANANGKHLCIEVNGTTQIPKVASYTASVVYTGVTDAVLPPGDANLALGGIGMGGSVVYIPYVNLNSANYVHRLQVFNRMNKAAAYRIDFLPPQGSIANPPSRTGSFAPGNTGLIFYDLVTLSRRSRTALTLAVDAPPELLQVQTILQSRRDGSTDTVTYTPE